MKKLSPRLLFSVVAVVLLALYTVLVSNGWLSFVDNTLQDQLYQEEQPTSGEVVIVGIDDRAIDELGPFSSWGRGVIARLINTLNVSEDIRPSAICLDIVFSGDGNP